MSTIAIVGSGISGMAAAYLLAPHHDLTLYEKDTVIGGHTRTRSVDYNGKLIPVDTGFIVFNHINYPELTAMFRYLGVATEKSDMTLGFTMDNGRFEWGAANLNAVFGQRSNLLKPFFYRMIGDVLKFFKHAPDCLTDSKDQSLDQLLTSLKLGADFRNHFILPMGAAIWSCPANKMLEFPAKTFVQFFMNHGLLSLSGQHQWHTVSSGSQQYVKKLMASLAGHVKLHSPVTRVWNEGSKVAVQTAAGDKALYDHVVLASHADESLHMLEGATDEERNILGTFKYQPNRAFLHCDTNQMPKRKACWSAWNYSAGDNQQVSLTYWMNRLQNIDNNYPLFVTLNPITPIAKDKIFDEHLFDHPIFTREAITAQAMIPSLQGQRNIWFCGAYQRYGFHEDGLISAIAVAKRLGADIPWH